MRAKLLLLLVLLCIFEFTHSSPRGEGGRGGSFSGGFSKSSGGGRSSKISNGKKIAIIAAGGVATYAAYRGYKNSHNSPDPKNSKQSDGGLSYEEQPPYYIVQGSVYSQRGEPGMSAFGILMLILGGIGSAFVAWCCYNVGIPYWKDRQSQRNRSLSFSNIDKGFNNGNKVDADIPLYDNSKHSKTESNTTSSPTSV